MAPTPLVLYQTEAEYRSHFLREYCGGHVQTFDCIPVFFNPGQFDHCFFESTRRDGVKDVFSTVRAKRIDWIGATLRHPGAALFAGWNKKRKAHEQARRVAVVHDDFVVVIGLRLKADDSLKANFVTCYDADNSIAMIKRSPVWSKAQCLTELGA